MTLAAPPELDLAALAAVCLLIDPIGLGGAVIEGPADPARTAWLDALRAALPAATPWARLPSGISDDRLIGGLDLAATLATGRPVAEQGLLAGADGGVVVLPMAERASAQVIGALAAAFDAGVVRVQRDGIALESAARLMVLALDEHEGDEAPVARALAARVAFHLHVPAAWAGDAPQLPMGRELMQLRVRYAETVLDEAGTRALVGAAAAFGVHDVRATLFAARAACALAALDERSTLSDEDLTTAVRLVLVPRATRLPAPAPDEDAPPPPPPPDASSDESPDDEATTPDEPLADQVIEAVLAALPASLLEALGAKTERQRSGAAGRSGAMAKATARGRQVGTVRGLPRGGKRLDLLATLRTAAPWQRLRGARMEPGERRLAIRAEDLRIRRLKQRVGTTVIFAVDASGSQAVNRLGEAKGAIELLLAESYVRRDRVALLVFRGASCEIALPPTRSLARAKRTLAGLPGGGGTPLASGIDAAGALGQRVRREGGKPLVVFLTDGRANVARDGAGGRPKAEAEAAQAAQLFGAQALPALVVDTSPRPNAALAALARTMGARYAPLPVVRADILGAAVRAVMQADSA